MIRRALALCLLALLAPMAVRADETGRDREPAPPWIFFDLPDPQTAVEISGQVARFADLNHVAIARDALVRRYGVLSRPRLVEILGAEGRQPRNEPLTWNAALTAYALRNTWGNARELWPLVQPLTTLLDESAEPYRRAFSALALGAFRGPDFAPAPPARTDPSLPFVPEDRLRKNLAEALSALARHVDHYHPHVRVAVALSLGKSGAPSAREYLKPETRLGGPTADAVVEPRQAVLLAVGLLPGQDDEPLLLAALKDEQRDIRRAAALAAAVQSLHDHPPGWTNAPDRILRALKSGLIRMHLEDGAEAVFARGVLAAEGLATPEWRELFEIAQRPSTEEEAARAAAQCLLFCEEPWFPEQVLRSVVEGVDLKPTVLAAFLLLLGTEATEAGVEVCRHYLGNRGLRPRGKPEWDVRYFAAVGLLRALASGRLTDETRRAQVLAALDEGLRRGRLQAGPFRDALEEEFGHERRQLTENAHYALPEERVLAIERSFRDPHGLFARDLHDMTVVRLNDMVPVVFNVNQLKPGAPGDRDKSEMPRRYLKACHDDFPYFTRLDLMADRGRRPAPPRGQDDEWGVDR